MYCFSTAVLAAPMQQHRKSHMSTGTSLRTERERLERNKESLKERGKGKGESGKRKAESGKRGERVSTNNKKI